MLIISNFDLMKSEKKFDLMNWISWDSTSWSFPGERSYLLGSELRMSASIWFIQYIILCTEQQPLPRTFNVLLLLYIKCYKVFVYFFLHIFLSKKTVGIILERGTWNEQKTNRKIVSIFFLSLIRISFNLSFYFFV